MLEASSLPNFERDVLPHLDAAFNLARWLTRNQQDAEDAVQEGCLRALRFFRGFHGGDARAWLMKIVRNICYTRMHASGSLKHAVEFDENLLPPDSRALNPEEAALQDSFGNVVRKALETLPPNYREVLILRELEGMSYREIAGITGMPAGTVMSSISRARGRLRQTLADVMNAKAPPGSRQIAGAAHAGL